MPELGDKKLFKGETVPRVYAFNPSKNFYGFYSQKQIWYQGLITDINAYVKLGFSDENNNRARALRENITDVLELKASSNISEKLIYDAKSILNGMSDAALEKFGKDNYTLIQHYFKYEDSGNDFVDMDARLFLLIEKLGINPLDDKYKNDKKEILKQHKLDDYDKNIEEAQERHKKDIGLHKIKL